MTFIDPRKLDKHSPEQRAQYQEFLKAYPHLASKMDTSRQLNTPVAQEMKASGGLQPPIPHQGEDLPDLEAIDYEQRADDYQRPIGGKVVGEVKVDSQRASMLSLDQEEKMKDQRLKERIRRQREEEAREDAQERQAEMGGGDPPPAGRVAPEPKKKPPRFSPTGKRHPVLLRMRQSLGMEELEQPQTVEVQGVKYTFKRLSREEITHAVSVSSSHNADDTNMRSYIETAIVAYACREIDGEVIADVFEVPYREMRISTGKEENLLPKEREDKGAHLLFEELLSCPTELTDLLLVFYEQNFPPVNLLEGGSSLALCPTSGCQHRALVGAESARYCPFHGKELRREGTLPNPS